VNFKGIGDFKDFYDLEVINGFYGIRVCKSLAVLDNQSSKRYRQ